MWVKGWCYIRQNVLKYGFSNFPAILLLKAFGLHPVSFFPFPDCSFLNLQTILSILPWSTRDNKISDVISGQTCFYKWSVAGPFHMVRNSFVIQRPESSRLSSNSAQSIRFGFWAKVTDKRENLSEIISDLFIFLRNLV